MLKNEHGIFKDIVNPETGEIFKEAEQVYREWLENKDNKIDICPKPTTEERVLKLEKENAIQTENITTNNDMIFTALDATTELNESNIMNTEMVLISMDALAEINEQLIALQEQISVLKGGV